MDVETLRARIEGDADRIVDELSRLVSIPSVGYPGYDPANVRASAEATAAILQEAGVSDAGLLEIAGGHPAVFGQIPGPPGAPSVLLYAHHDVQPAGDGEAWSTPPFEPHVAEGRLYGRGAADDKSGIVAHAAALRALGAHEGAALPCTVKVIVEGEEECSTEHLPELVQGHAELLRADVAIIADGGNHRTGIPTIGTSVRGATSCRVRVDVLPIAQHSGSYGGPLPDAITALARIIASLHDDEGNVAIPGLHAFEWKGAPVSEAEFREESRVFDEVRLLGAGTIADRTLSQPAVNVLAIEAVPIVDAANQIVPSAEAIVGLRLAPGDDVERANDLLAQHLRDAAPWGVRVTATPGNAGRGYLVDQGTPVYAAAEAAMAEAFANDVLAEGSGGSIPLVPLLADTIPGIQILIIGAGDHVSNYHSVDESVDLGDLGRLALAEALLIGRLNGGSA